MGLIDELSAATDKLAQARQIVEQRMAERDSIIIRAVREGYPKREIAAVTGMAPVSIYKIMGQIK